MSFFWKGYRQSEPQLCKTLEYLILNKLFYQNGISRILAEMMPDHEVYTNAWIWRHLRHSNIKGRKVDFKNHIKIV